MPDVRALDVAKGDRTLRPRTIGEEAREPVTAGSDGGGAR